MNGAEWVRFGVRNVRSLREREEELVEQMIKYRLEVLGRSETKLKGNGTRAVGKGMCFFWSSGGESEGWSGCVSFKEDRQVPEGVKCVSERIVKIRLRIEGMWASVVQVYAPTEDCKEDVKEGFYEQLQTTLWEVHRQDKLIVMGDLNARVGRNVGV